MILHDDGRLVVDWHDTPTHRPRACIVARDLFDEVAALVAALQPKPDEAAFVAELRDAIEADHAAAPLVDAAPTLPTEDDRTAQTHVIVDEEGVMLDVVTGVSAPYVVLLGTHHNVIGPGAMFGLDAPAARRLAARLTAAADDAP